MSKKSFIKGAAVLGAAGLIGKVIGAFYRIPLTNIIGPGGMGLYQIAYPIYAFLLVVSTAGIPTAISKMVSERLAVGDKAGAYRIFQTSFRVLLVIGIFTSVLMLIGNRALAGMIGNREAGLPILAIAPALFFVSILSSYRGYFQGMQMMEPTAVSQVIEQLGKLILGFGLAYRWNVYGAAYGAAGALVGVTLSEVAALVLLMGFYHGKRKAILQEAGGKRNSFSKDEFTRITAQLARIAVPVTLGASIIPLVSFLDTAIVINRLKGIGIQQDQATALFGILTAVVNPLVNMPAVFTVALSMSLVPAISQSYAIKDLKNVRAKAATGLRLAFILGIPSAVGLFILAHPIIGILYRSLNAAQTTIASELLRTMAVAVLFLSVVQTLTGILQGIDRVKIPVRNLLIGAVLKIIINYILVGIPSINIQGAPIGTLVCYGAAAFLNIMVVIRETKINFSWMEMIGKPGIAAVFMGTAVWFIRKWASNMYDSNILGTSLAILAGIVIYFILLLMTKALQEEDIASLPGGKKLRRFLIFLGIWKNVGI